MSFQEYEERYAKVERDYADYISLTKSDTSLDAQYPHCDSLILHVPGICEYCDRHPDWQEARRSMGIAFTGETPDIFQRPCPASVLRPVEKIEKWHGNVAMTAEQNEEYYAERQKEFESLWADYEGAAKIENIKVHDHVLTAEEIIRGFWSELALDEITDEDK